MSAHRRNAQALKYWTIIPANVDVHMFPNALHHQPLTLIVVSVHVCLNHVHHTNTLIAKHAAVSAGNILLALRIKFSRRTRVSVSVPGSRSVGHRDSLAMTHVAVSVFMPSHVQEIKSLIKMNAGVNVTEVHTVLETLYLIISNAGVLVTGNATHHTSLTRAHVSVCAIRYVAQATN